MPKVSINILTKNRATLLARALSSLANQSFEDYQLVIINDGSTDTTEEVLKNLKIENLKIITHNAPQGITFSRQEALYASTSEYIAILDDDDEWIDQSKLTKQLEFLQKHPEYVLIGGAIQTLSGTKYRAKTDKQIRQTMLLRNNFFTSTVMFRKDAALKAGGFVNDGNDFTEDYDLWLRLGRLGKMYNFQEIFAKYTTSHYNKAKFKAFLTKQLRLIKREKSFYPHYWLSYLILKLRTIF